MAQITIDIQREQDVTFLTVKGRCTIDEIATAAIDHLREHPTRKALWDFQDADGSAILAEDMRRLYRLLAALPESSQLEYVANVVSRPLGYGLTRISATIAELSGLKAEFGIFYSRDEALAWLGL